MEQGVDRRVDPLAVTEVDVAADHETEGPVHDPSNEVLFLPG